MSAPIEAGACYRDPKDGEIVRALRPSPHYQHGWLCQPLSGVYRGQAEVYRALLNWQRVPDPTPAVIDDEPALHVCPVSRCGAAAFSTADRCPVHGAFFVAEDRPAHDEAARQERVDATARALFASAEHDLDADEAYAAADDLEAARERYIASRKGAVKP